MRHGATFIDVQLHAATVRRIVEPKSIDDLEVAFVTTRFDNRDVSICVGRHARDGQQFGRNTVLLERDTDSFLPRAVEPSVCIVCNLHVAHTDAGKAKAAAHFRRIIARAIQHHGRYYLT